MFGIERGELRRPTLATLADSNRVVIPVARYIHDVWSSATGTVTIVLVPVLATSSHDSREVSLDHLPAECSCTPNPHAAGARSFDVQRDVLLHRGVIRTHPLNGRRATCPSHVAPGTGLDPTHFPEPDRTSGATDVRSVRHPCDRRFDRVATPVLLVRPPTALTRCRS